MHLSCTMELPIAAAAFKVATRTSVAPRRRSVKAYDCSALVSAIIKARSQL